MRPNYAVEYKRTKKPSGEEQQSLKLSWGVAFLVGAIIAALLADAGFIERDDLPLIFQQPTTEAPQVPPTAPDRKLGEVRFNPSLLRQT